MRPNDPLWNVLFRFSFPKKPTIEVQLRKFQHIDGRSITLAPWSARLWALALANLFPNGCAFFSTCVVVPVGPMQSYHWLLAFSFLRQGTLVLALFFHTSAAPAPVFLWYFLSTFTATKNPSSIGRFSHLAFYLCTPLENFVAHLSWSQPCLPLRAKKNPRNQLHRKIKSSRNEQPSALIHMYLKVTCGAKTQTLATLCTIWEREILASWSLQQAKCRSRRPATTWKVVKVMEKAIPQGKDWRKWVFYWWKNTMDFGPAILRSWWVWKGVLITSWILTL